MEDGEGILLYLVSHLIDEILWVVGSKAERVYEELNLRSEYRIDETASFTTRFKIEVLARLNLSARL